MWDFHHLQTASKGGATEGYMWKGLYPWTCATHINTNTKIVLTLKSTSSLSHLRLIIKRKFRAMSRNRTTQKKEISQNENEKPMKARQLNKLYTWSAVLYNRKEHWHIFFAEHKKFSCIWLLKVAAGLQMAMKLCWFSMADIVEARLH